MNDLARKKCVPCEGGVAPLTDEQVRPMLKGLQDCLGTYQDCQVQQEEIRAIAAELLAGGGVPATALLAMGDLASHVGQRERRARSEFSSRFAEVASHHAQARFEVLTASARS